MNKQQLTIYYFAQQKIVEVLYILLIIVLFFSIPTFVGSILLGDENEICDWTATTMEDANMYPCGILNHFVFGLFGIVLFIIALIAFYLTIRAIFKSSYYLFSDWIDNNWKKASHRAKEKIRSQR